MAEFNIVFLSIVFFAATGSILAIVTDDEKMMIRRDLTPFITSCGVDNSVSKEDVMTSEKENSATLNPCFYACVMKKIGFISDDGLFQPAAAKHLHKKYIHDEEDLEKLDGIADVCSIANSRPVSDGIKGCDRAKMVVDCLLENKNNFLLMTE